MSNSKDRPGTGGLAENLRQEVEFILAQASMEPWVIEEARRIEEARAVKASWADVLRSRA